MNWDTDNISDLKGKIIIVTGSNCGIGYETAKALAEKNATVIMAVRSLERDNKAASEIQGNVMKLDLASLKSVKKFSDNFKKKYSRLNIRK